MSPDYDSLWRLVSDLADFTLAGGLNSASEARALLSDEHVADTIDEMIETWAISSYEVGLFATGSFERRFIFEKARARVELSETQD